MAGAARESRGLFAKEKETTRDRVLHKRTTKCPLALFTFASFSPPRRAAPRSFTFLPPLGLRSYSSLSTGRNLQRIFCADMKYFSVYARASSPSPSSSSSSSASSSSSSSASSSAGRTLFNQVLKKTSKCTDNCSVKK
jgi:hypothetical protein